MRHWKERLAAMAMATGFLLLGAWFFPQALRGMDHIFYDYAVANGPLLVEEPRIVIVDVDEKSIDALGAWPWPRPLMAELIDRLVNQYQVAVLGVDIVFPNPRTGDELLKKAMVKPQVVASQTFAWSGDASWNVGVLQDSFLQVTEFSRYQASQAPHYLGNAPSVLAPSTQVGHISPLLDEDGKLRRIYPVICHQKQCSKALALRMWQALSEDELQFDDRGVFGARWRWLPTGRRVELDAHGAMLVPYRVAPNGFIRVSAQAVLDERVPLTSLQNRVVLLGSTALGLGDRVVTPIESVAPGVEVHAQLLSALLDDALLIVWPFSLLWGGLWILVAAGLLLRYWPWRGAIGILAWGGIQLVAVVFLHLLLLYHANVLIEVAWVAAWIILVTFIVMTLESRRVSEQVSKMMHNFSHFLPASLVDKIAREEQVHADAQRQTITVLVADMRGFTQACEGRAPEVVAVMAQRCLSTLGDVVHRHQGTIEKYTGDGLMAMWGAPSEDGQHVKHAVRAACDMQAAIRELAPWLRSHDLPIMKLSVGLNTGVVAVGLYGDKHHLAWSAQGDAVNLASRIEQLTRVLGQDLLMGRQTAELWGMERCVSLGWHSVKGRVAPVEVFTLKTTDAVI